ncbi:MAG: hypothetical protein IT310_00615 [Anaerolineales bacterium]|nr:hypothetical protein [Anaerolineales bacterium]
MQVKLLKLLKDKSMLVVFALTLLLVLTYTPVLLSERVLDAFVREDQIYETLSPIYLFVTCILFFIAFKRSPIKLSLKDPNWLKRLAFLGLACMFFLAAGEEISWGQRILHIATPNLIKGVNVQEELTFHNLNFFQGEHEVVSFSKLSILFTFTIGLLIPLACWLFEPLRKFVANKFPILPLQYGFLIPINYIIQKALVRILPRFPNLYHHPTMPIPQGIHEIREHNYELILMAAVLAYILLKLDLKDSATEAETTP